MEEPIELLVVEDNPDDYAILQARLANRRDFRITRHTPSLAGAIAALDARRFDCVIADFHLLDGTALQLLAAIALRNDCVPVVVLTATDDDKIARDALKAGAQDYLVKSELTTRAIQRSVHYAIERWRSESLGKRLAESDRLYLIGELAASMGHEINNPATYVLGTLRMIAEQVASQPASDGEGLAKMVEDCIDGVERIAESVGCLQEFASSDPGEVEWIDVNELVESAGFLATRRFPSVELQIEVGPSEPVAGRRAHLSHAIAHLIMGAAKSAVAGANERETPRVRVRTESSRQEVDVRITVFGVAGDRWANGVTRLGGVGVGLSLAAEAARAHGGLVRFDGLDGEGSCAVFRIATETGLVVPDSGAESCDRILLVTSEAKGSSAYERLLSAEYSVQTVSSGMDAMALIHDAEPAFDLVLIDGDLSFAARVHDIVTERWPDYIQRMAFIEGGRLQDSLRSRAPVIAKPLTISTVGKVLAERRTCRSRPASHLRRARLRTDARAA